MAGETLTTTSNFSYFPQEHVRKALLEKGERVLAYHDAADKVPLPKGESKNISFGRYKAIPVVLSALSSEAGSSPTPTALAIDRITATVSEYAHGIKISDMHRMTVMHDSWRQGEEELKIATDSSRDYLLQNVINAGTNVRWANSKASRAALTTGDIWNSSDVKKCVSSIRNPYGQNRGAPRFAGGRYKVLCHEKLAWDLQDDTVWSAAAARQASLLKDLQDGTFGVWNGCEFISTDFSPEFQNLGNPTIVNTVAVVSGDVYSGAPQQLVGFKSTSSAAAGSLSNGTAYDLGITAINKYRGFEERISGVLDVTTGGADTQFILTMPSDTDFVYNVYAGTDSGTMYLVSSGNEAAATVNVQSIPSTTSFPLAPAEEQTVYCAHVFGRQAFATIDLFLEDVIIADKADKTDPANLYGTMYAKWADAGCLTNSNWIYRIESTSAYT